MQTIVETVRIKSPVSEGNELGFVLINKEDLTDEHELFDVAETPATPVAPTAQPAWANKA